MIVKLKKVNVLRLACVMSLFYAFIAFIMVSFFALTSSLFTGMFLAKVPMIILGPILYGIGGFIGGLLMGWVYNLVSKWIGGIEFEFEKIEKFGE